jgi:hypothetical protein
MYLQLAEGENNGNYQALAESNPLDNYVFIPGGFLPEFNNDTYVRADYFASNYDTATANALINQLNNMQTTGLSVVGVGAVASAGIGLAKKLVANRQAKVQAGTAKPIGKPGGILDKIRTKIQGAPQEKNTQIPPFNFQGNVGGATGGITFQPKPEDEQAPMSFWQKYKTPILIGGGALVLIGGVYMFTRKKRR